MRLNKFFAVALAYIVAATPVFAQTPSSAPPVPIFAPTVTAALSVTSASARQALGSDATIWPAVTLYNSGSNTAYCVGGGSTVTATTSSPVVVNPSERTSFWAGTATYIACITASSTTTVSIAQSSGGPVYSGLAPGAASAAGQSLPLPAGSANIGNVFLASQFPAGSTVVKGVGNGTTGTIVATCAAPADGTTLYLVGFTISGANTVTATLTTAQTAGQIGSAMQFFIPYPVAPLGFGPYTFSFPVPVPASAANTAITLTQAFGGATGNYGSTIFCYKQ